MTFSPKRFFKYMTIFIIGIIVILVAGSFAFINFYPSFGAKSVGARLERMKQSPNHTGERFTNVATVKEDFEWNDYKKMIRKMLKGNPNGTPSDSIPSKQWTANEVKAINDSIATAVWYGHSAFYLKMNGKNILLDPMFGDFPAPAPYLIKRRFKYKLPIEISDLPHIDLVVFSHDHYDHLDYPSVLKLREKVKHWLVPLGIGAHLERWGVPSNQITELYWHEEFILDDIKLVCTPAQHFSGRGTSDKQHTLWASWVIAGDQKIYFSGDSGYFPGFKDIGQQYGPFDIAFMECGQYDELWPDIHMFPEETAQAAIDVQAKSVMPIHWGGFVLGNHDWDDPIKRVTKAADSLNISVVTPVIGEKIVIGESEMEYVPWWKTIGS